MTWLKRKTGCAASHLPGKRTKYDQGLLKIITNILGKAIKGKVIKVDDFDKHREKFKDKADNETPYQSRKYRMEELDVKGNRWILPIVIFLVVLVGAGATWFLGSRNIIGLPGWAENIFTPGEEKVRLAVPEEIFATQDLDQVIARAIEEQGVDEISRDDEGNLVYIMSLEVREQLFEEAEKQLQDKFSAIRDQEQYPEILSISSDDAYKEFYLVTVREQASQAIFIASELFMLSVYYQYLNTEDLVREVSMQIEDRESGDLLEQFAYPGDLSQVAKIIEDPPDFAEEPATPQPGDKVIVSTGPDNLNVRSGPEITFLIIEILRSGTILEVTGSDGVWLEVITPEGTEGWVHGDFVEPHNNGG